MHRHLLFFFFVALLGLFLVPTAALAQPTGADRTTARALGQEGHDALDSNDFATAADRFARADALVHAPTLMLGLAQAQVGLGKLVSALDTYNRILREGVLPKSPAPFVLALEGARKELAALELRIPYVIIQVAGAGAAAVKVSVDGADVPAAVLGVKLAVDPGKHMIRASAEGFATSEVAMTLAEGRTETVTLEMKPSRAAPIVAPKPPPEVQPPPPAPSSSGSIRRTLGIAGLVAGGAGLGLGAVMGGLVIAKHGELARSCPDDVCPLSLKPQLDTYHTYSAVSTVGFIVGGVLAGSGAVLLLTAPKPRPAAFGVTIDPVLGLGWVGAEGRF